MQDSLEQGGPTKFVVTRGDNRVCQMCLDAESDGVIPYDQPYSNGKQHPSFHGHTCRCREMTSGELVQGIDVRVQGNNVDVGFHEERTAQGAFTREFGSGNGPPQPDLLHSLDTEDIDFFQPFFNDLTEIYKRKFME